MMYVKVDWPESQIVQEFKGKYLDECYYVDGMSVFVPEPIWALYKRCPDEVIITEEEFE